MAPYETYKPFIYHLTGWRGDELTVLFLFLFIFCERKFSFGILFCMTFIYHLCRFLVIDFALLNISRNAEDIFLFTLYSFQIHGDI